MITWFSENIGTIVICLIIAVFVFVAIVSIIRNRKKGKSCSGGCDGCAYSGSCGRSGDKNGTEK